MAAAFKSQPAGVLPVLTERWSPRSFADVPVDAGALRRCFVAAGCAASAFNEQPWRFVVAERAADPAGWERLFNCLVEANRVWAQAAPVLFVTVLAERFAKNGRANGTAAHDLGLAMGNFSAQATHEGLQLHQMAGIDADHAQEVLGVPENFRPFTAVAVGHPGNPDTLPEGWMREAERAARTRSEPGDFVFSGRFGRP